MKNETFVKLGLTAVISLFAGCGTNPHDRNATVSYPETTLSVGKLSHSSATSSTSTGTVSSQRSPSSDEEETPLMRKLGLQFKDGAIILDTEKSKHFFESLKRSIGRNIHRSVKEAEEKLPKSEDLGIHIQDNKVVIDLNRTKSFMKEWIETMEVLGKELNRSLAPLRP